MTKEFQSSPGVSLRNVISFIWRGAAGGAIIPLGAAIYAASFYGSPLLVLLSPVLSVPLGVTVGVILLLFCTFADRRLRLVWRIIVGGAVLAVPNVIYSVLSAGPVIATQTVSASVIWLAVFRPAVWYGAIGALAGMCCPAGISPGSYRPDDPVDSFRDWVPPTNHSSEKES